MLFDLKSFWLISGIFGFSVFAIEHIRKPGKYGKFSEAHFSKYLVYLSDFEQFYKNFVCSRQKSEVVAQSHQGALIIEACGLLSLLKPKWCVDYKLIAF